MVKFQTGSRTTTVKDSLVWGELKRLEEGETGLKVEMSRKTLYQAKGDHLLTELLQSGDKVNVKLSDYISDNQSEVTLQDFWNKITSGNLDFKYIENVELPENLVKDFDLKWNFKTETFLQEVLEGEMVGITKPTYYFGSAYSAFPFHREDGDVRSVSYLIAGSPKVCYRFPF